MYSFRYIKKIIKEKEAIHLKEVAVAGERLQGEDMGGVVQRKWKGEKLSNYILIKSFNKKERNAKTEV